MLFEYEKNSSAQSYKLMSQTIIPRPIAWIVTQDGGIVNIAPFSYFAPLSSEPPTVIVSIGQKSNKEPKDTLYNIRKSRKCTICIVDPVDKELMDKSSMELPKNVSEAKKFSIDLKMVAEGFPPMISSSPTALFCDYYKEIELPDSKSTPIILKIQSQFVDDKYIIDHDSLKINFNTIGRVGKSYCFINQDKDIH